MIAQAIELAERNTCELKAAESRETQAVSDRHESVKRKADQPPNSGPNTKQWCANFKQRNVESMARLAI